MTILADTDVLIDFLAGTQPITDQITLYIDADQLQTSAITVFELLCGNSKGKKADALEKLIGALPLVPVDANAARMAAAERKRLAREGYSMSMADSLIAGVALSRGMPLFTRNRKHFDQVEGLKLVSVKS
jgi:tRNA(fMet)-specific endonuclease VapC